MRLLLLRLLLVSVGALEMIEQDAPRLTCSKGLTGCLMRPSFPFLPSPPDPRGDSVNVTQLKLQTFLCCSGRQQCQPCLQVIITLQEIDDGRDEQSMMTEKKALVKVCLSSPGSLDLCRDLQLMVNRSSSDPSSHHQLLLTESVTFGSLIDVSVKSKSVFFFKDITFPGLSAVCSMNHEGSIKECDVPGLRLMNDNKRDVIVLQLENSYGSEKEALVQMVWNDFPGKVFVWPKDKAEMLISSHSVTPCLCFKLWWKGNDLYRKYCPFKNQQAAMERMQHNVSVSMVEAPMGSRGGSLIWSVTAPCRLEGEVWLCRKELNERLCQEVNGSRLELQTINATGMSQQTGEFNALPSPLLCVQLKIKGMKSHLEPHCPFTSSNSRWGLIFVILLLLVILATLGACFLQRFLRAFIWKWLNNESFTGAVGGAHLVLLCPPGSDRRLPALLCHLGSILQALGFSISLDLWSSRQLSILGPIPWLYSQLDRLQRQGGKVVLVLTQEACTRAEEWERKTPKESKEEEQEEEGSCSASSCFVDIFSATLSCIFTDYLQGCAGERFIFVQFDSLQPEHPGISQSLPYFFRGLHVYKVPSQSLGFLTELAGAQKSVTASSRWKLSRGLWKASCILNKRLSRFTAGSNFHLSGISRSCVDEKDGGDLMLLQTFLITPPSSPDTNCSASELQCDDADVEGADIFF